MELPSKKKVFITGITGFTGIHLEEKLKEQGFLVYGTTINDTISKNHFNCDILNEESLFKILDQVRPDYIIHLAAISFVAVKNKKNIYDVNIFGTINLLNSITRLNYVPSKILIASTATVYGNVEGELNESMCPQPVNHYGNSKLVMENMVKQYFESSNIVIVRPFNYTGIGQENHFLIPKIVSHYKLGKKEIELGNIEVYREFNDVDFVIDCYQKLLFSNIKSEIFNICTGKAYCINDILGIMNKIAGYNIKVKVNPQFIRKNEISVLKGSPAKLFSYIKRTKQGYDIENTLKKMLNN